MKVLCIGQVPKEVGGNYTTGIARVVYELSKQSYSKVRTFLYSTNIKEKDAKDLCTYDNQYMGYKIDPVGFLLDLILHPIKTIKRWKHYVNKSFNNPLRFDFMRYNFERAIKQVKPDLIHMHGAGLDSLYFANEKYQIPILLTLHGVMWDGDENDQKTKKRYMNNMGLADYYSGLNQEVKRKMLKIHIPKNKITLIPNGVDTSKFYYSTFEREHFRKNLNVPKDRIVFITVGVIIDRKGQFASLKILESLGIDFEYWIIGHGPDESIIKEYVDMHKLSDRIKLLGYINDTELYKYHSAADIYIHASDMEGQALSETEAYATGLKVIVNKKIAQTVVGDVINDNQTYYILDYDNINVESLKDWIYSAYQRESKSSYSWSKIAQLYEDLYFSINGFSDKDR